jgi:antitoxin (DNA-binding transcriptional repressor) of toxin-antitoxin stability system
MKAVAAMANCAWLAASIPAWRRFRTALRQPEQTQQKILHDLLARNAASLFGKAHGFDQIRTVAQFRQQVPIVGYDDLAPWIARIMRGEQSVLTREPVARLLPTSGSNGARKLIPFTAGLQRQFNAAIGPWMVDLCRQHPSVPFGPAYWSISPALPASPDEESAVPVGFDDDSAYLGGIRKRLVEATFAVSSTLRLVEDIECSRYLTVLSLLRQRELRFVSVWHPSFLTLLLDAMRVFWDELLADVDAGGCRRAAALPDGVRNALDAPPMPRRALELRRAGHGDPHSLWPHLGVVSCWGDSPAGLALADLQHRLPSAAIQPKGLLATEAFVSIPFGGRHPVAVASHFFEFLDARGDARLADELHAGETYTVIVSTAGGLWRYRLGDLVEVDGFVEATPSLRFIGRGDGVSDLCGEKLTEIFVMRAIESACAARRCSPRFAMLAPEIGAGGHGSYTLFVEGEVPDDLPACLDKELRTNPHYSLCRDLGQLGPLRVFKVSGDAYMQFCKVVIEDGRRLGDIKPQSLSLRADWRSRFTRERAASTREQDFEVLR